MGARVNGGLFYELYENEDKKRKKGNVFNEPYGGFRETS